MNIKDLKSKYGCANFKVENGEDHLPFIFTSLEDKSSYFNDPDSHFYTVIIEKDLWHIKAGQSIRCKNIASRCTAKLEFQEKCESDA